MNKSTVQILIIVISQVSFGQQFGYQSSIELVRDSAWTDLTYPASLINPVGSASPPLIEDSTSYLLFANAAVNTVAIVFQLPHDYKVGSEIRFHVHWCKATASAGEVYWQTKYKWTSIGAVSIGWSSLTPGAVSVSHSDLAYKHSINSWPAWDGTGKGISSLVTIWLERTGTDGANDTYGSPAKLMSVDLHYQRDSFGSSTEYTK